MTNYIVIDGGTTNTRISLVQDGAVADTLKLHQGARSAIEGREALSAAITEGIKTVLSRNGLTNGDIKRILASGMITSEFGLYKVDHIVAPAGVAELHRNMREVTLSEISPIPFVFVSGVKTACDTLENADMMRGEETELVGIISESGEKAVYVLPGSHSKIIFTDESGRIINFHTMLTGEMTAALSQNTILRDAVRLGECSTDTEYLLMGYRYAQKNGINEALFKTRILKNIFGASHDQAYSFFCGAVLSGEIDRILSMGAKKIYIGGRRELKEQLSALLSLSDDIEVLSIDEKTAAEATVKGILKIYEYEDN